MRCERCLWRAPVLYRSSGASLEVCSGCFLEAYHRLPDEHEIVEEFDPRGRWVLEPDLFGDWQ